MTVVGCKLPKKLAAKLERVAKDERRSKQAVLREAIEKGLNAKRRAVRDQACVPVKEVVGTLKGPSDPATNPEDMQRRRSGGRSKSMKAKPGSFAEAVGRALKRAAKVARKTARMYGTPIYVSRGGKVVAVKP